MFGCQGHGAANVTLGIPRLREIVMTASQKPKTPSMNVGVVSGVSLEDVEKFCKGASRLTMSQVVEKVTVTEAFVVNGEARRTRFTIDIAFFPRDEYEAEYDVEPFEILATFASKFPLILKKEMQLEMKKLDANLKSQIADLGKGKTVKKRSDEDDDEDGKSENELVSKGKDDDESDAGDGDAEDAKRAKQKRQQISYESDDEDEESDSAFDSDEVEDELTSNIGGEEQEVGSLGRSGSLQKRVKKVARLFKSNMHQATSFQFTETACTFQVEVRQFLATLTTG
jgi:hypothetical protein